MLSFNLGVESVERLIGLSNLSDKLEKVGDGVLLSFANDRLNCHVYGNKSILEYSVDADSLIIGENDLNYIKVDFTKFKQAIKKCNVGQSGVSVKVDTEKNKITVTPVGGKTPKIDISCYDTVDAAQADVILRDWELRKESPEFSSGVESLTVNNEFIAGTDEMIRLMGISATCNAFGVTDKKIYYADRLSVIERDISESATTSTEMLMVTAPIYEFLKSIIKETKETVVVDYSSSRDFVRIDSNAAGVRAVVWVGTVQFVYPESEDYEMIVPSPDRKKSIKVQRTELLDALEKFDGIFNASEYKWRQFNLVNSSEGKIHLEYSDNSAEVHTDVGITEVVNNLPTQDFKFQMSGLILTKILGMISDAEIVIEYSDEPSNEPHGMGVSISGEKIKVVCCKLNTDE